MAKATQKQSTEIPVGLLALLGRSLGVDEDEITRDARLVDDLGADSLDVVELVMDLEREYKIDMTESDEDRFGTATVQDVIDILKRHGAKL